MSVFIVKGRRRWLRFFWKKDQMEVNADTYDEAGIIASRRGLKPIPDAQGRSIFDARMIAHN